MVNSLDIGEWTDDPFKNTEIYTAFINKAILEDADRESLKKERGFSDEIINLCQFKSCRPENREIIKELEEQFGEDALLEAGLLEAKDDGIKPCTQLFGVFKNDKFVNNICIPYFNTDGEIFYIRPHKFGLKAKQIQVYCPARKIPADSTWIITESEFKAAAAIQLGYPAIGLPGIHSFMVKHFPRLEEFIKTLGVHNIVVVYDNEIKNNPSFKNFKPDVIKQWHTQWRSVDICRKLIKAIPELDGYTKIGLLPNEWMEDGKIDIDGALAQGRTKAEFKSVIHRALEWQDYVHTLPTIARKIINRKVYKEDYLATSKIKKLDNGYFIEKQKKIGKDDYIPYDEQLTNFTMEIKKTLIEGVTHIREVVFRGQDGSVSKPHICKVGTNIIREFKTWVWSCGDYHFTGKQDELDLIWKLEGAMCDGREIQRPEKIGHVEGEDGDSIWLFGNILLKEDGSALVPDKEGIIWEGLQGYLPKSIKEDTKSKATVSTSKMPMVNIDPNIKFGLPEIKKMINDVEIIFDNKSVKLAIGWVIACLLSEEIFRKYACFPILFIGGKRECGKTTLGNWLMAMTGQADTAGDSIGGTTPAGALRNLAWFSCLPYWLDEYRNNNRITNRWEGLLRNVYQRQSPSKGTLGASIRTHTIKAGVLLSGEETPQDNALLSRCIQIPLVKNRDKSSTLEKYKELENLRTQNLMSRLIPEIIKLKSDLMPLVLEHIDGWKQRLLNEGVGERIALNYAIPAVCYDLFLLRN
jgi:DNA primase